MGDAETGWIAAIVVGGIAGWLVEQYLRTKMGFHMTILLGIVGAVVANFLLNLSLMGSGGWMGYLIASLTGACILIALGYAVRKAGQLS